MREGWLLCITDSGVVEIQRYDEGGKFKNDAQALAYVELRAAQGSAYHKAALKQCTVHKNRRTLAALILLV